jgi:uncharacterized protein YndB with AHSA1/START domain
MKTVLALLISWLLTQPALAGIVESTPNGFVIEQAIVIKAPVDKVYAALIDPASWWSSQHTFSGSAKNLSLEAKAGGCFCEVWPGGSVEHSRVVFIAPKSILRLRGVLGPFQAHGVDGALTFTLSADQGGTKLVLQNILGGFMKGGFGQWPERADAMLAEQVGRLKNFAETGAP